MTITQAAPDILGIGIVQMRSRPGSITANLDEAARRVVELSDQGARIIVLPELFATGYTLSEELGPLAAASHRDVLAALCRWARHCGVVIATAVATAAEDGTLENTAVIVGPEGLLATSAKSQLWGDEPTVFQRGNGAPALARTQFGVVGVAICYEAGFPEIAREMALAGADVIAVPAAFGRDRLYAWQILTRSRALENGCFVAAAGLSGNDQDRAYAGHSCIVSPTGEVIAELGDEVGSAVATVDLTDVQRARERIPYLSDLRRHAAPRPVVG